MIVHAHQNQGYLSHLSELNRLIKAENPAFESRLKLVISNNSGNKPIVLNFTQDNDCVKKFAKEVVSLVVSLRYEGKVQIIV